jgi:Tol biopolymer transport system component
MRLPAGARLGPYEIHSLIGAGGMGEVYKARDTRLERTVAIKLLPADLAERPDRRRRFEAEARAISALSHPNICTLFDVGEQDGRAFLVMEHLEGETLADRLTAGPLPAADVVRFGIQIAAALDHAHRAGIIHRDLKPSNVMLTASGAKLLDFGLARRPILEPVSPAQSTLSVDRDKLTAEGTIIGTVQYMAPEQLEGKPTDVRTDIFAFGTLVYEIATGRRAFEGDSQASLIASILTSQPPTISAAAADRGLPPALDHVIERCLAKTPDDRWQTARDVRLEMEWIAGGSKETARHAAAPARTARRRRELLAWAVAGVAVAGCVALWTVVGRRAGTAAELMRFSFAPLQGSVIGLGENRLRIALSPDGRYVAFNAITDGRQQIWLRTLSSFELRPLAGTEGGVSPFWSPDSRYLGFFAPGVGELRKIDVSGGPPRTISAVEVEGLAEWGSDNTILFTKFRDGIFRVSADGGEPARVTTINQQEREINHYWPSFLPGGTHFMYVATANETDTSKKIPSAYVAALNGGGDRQPLNGVHSRVLYVDPGFLLFVEDGTLFAQPFDLRSRRLGGEAGRVADRVSFFRTLGAGHFGASRTGALAYIGSGDTYQLLWFDRKGNSTDTGWAKQNYASIRFSPNGARVALDFIEAGSGTSDIWVVDVERGVMRRFTTEPPSERSPVWSLDGLSLLFSAEMGGAPNLYAKPFEAPGDVQPMVVHPGPLSSEDWSMDGHWIAYVLNTRQTGRDLWLKPTSGDRKERPFLNTRFDECCARFSPDSSLVAFVSDEANQIPEVFVAPVGRPEQRMQVSLGGGTAPRWRRNGKELFYAAPDNRSIMSVPVESIAPFRAGRPVRLFAIGSEPVSRGRAWNTVYDVTPDGERFLISVPFGESESSKITVVLNWTRALDR